MTLGIEGIIFYVVLIDSVMANIMVWFSPKLLNWYKSYWSKFAKEFPPAKGWCVYYFVLVVWIGYGLNRLGII